MGKKRRRRYSATEYFVAAIGLALIALVVGVIATSGSCKLRPASELGLQPSNQTPTPTPKPAEH
jgi:hypothetical protein